MVIKEVVTINGNPLPYPNAPHQYNIGIIIQVNMQLASRSTAIISSHELSCGGTRLPGMSWQPHPCIQAFRVPSKQGTIWHVSYWFVIGTAPPVSVFMCIHVNTRVLPVVTSLNDFDTSRTRSELVRFHWYVSSRKICKKNL